MAGLKPSTTWLRLGALVTLFGLLPTLAIGCSSSASSTTSSTSSTTPRLNATKSLSSRTPGDVFSVSDSPFWCHFPEAAEDDISGKISNNLSVPIQAGFNAPKNIQTVAPDTTISLSNNIPWMVLLVHPPSTQLYASDICNWPIGEPDANLTNGQGDVPFSHGFAENESDSANIGPNDEYKIILTRHPDTSGYKNFWITVNSA